MQDEPTQPDTGQADDLQAFVYAVSHDLGAPLRHVTGFAKLLRNALGSRASAEEQAWLDTILRSGERAQAMLAGLTELSRLADRRGPPGRVDLEALSTDVLKRLGEPDCIVRTGGKLPVVSGYAALYHRVLMELLGNALDACAGQTDARIELGTDERGWLTIHDNGHSFPAERLQQMLRPFGRGTDKAADADKLGLGLNIAMRALQLHGSRLHMTPHQPRGVTVAFPLPAEPPSYP